MRQMCGKLWRFWRIVPSHQGALQFSIAFQAFQKMEKPGKRWIKIQQRSLRWWIIRRPGSACTVFFSYGASKILSQGAHPKSPVQNPKFKIPKIQNPQNPKIQNPHNPKSKIPKIPTIQHPKSPKSKIPKIQNPSFFGRILGILGILDFGFGRFWILDLGFRPQNPKSKLPKIQNPKSKIPNPQNPKSPKSKIQNPQNPKSSAKIQNLGRWRPHVKNCYITIQNPKSKIPKIRPKKFGFWILGILDFGFWGFGDFGDFGDFGFWGFWMLDFWDFGDFGFWIVGILDFGFWDFGILGILDFGDFGDFGFWDFGDFGFWILGILGILDFGLGNLVTVPGGQRLESPLVCLWGPLQNQLYRIELGQGSKLNIFSEVRTLQNHRKTLTSNPEVRTLQNHRKTQTSNPEATSLLWTFWRKLMWITRVGGHRRQPVLNKVRRSQSKCICHDSTPHSNHPPQQTPEISGASALTIHWRKVDSLPTHNDMDPKNDGPWNQHLPSCFSLGISSCVRNNGILPCSQDKSHVWWLDI